MACGNAFFLRLRRSLDAYPSLPRPIHLELDFPIHWSAPSFFGILLSKLPRLRTLTVFTQRPRDDEGTDVRVELPNEVFDLRELEMLCLRNKRTSDGEHGIKLSPISVGDAGFRRLSKLSQLDLGYLGVASNALSPLDFHRRRKRTYCDENALAESLVSMSLRRLSWKGDAFSFDFALDLLGKLNLEYFCWEKAHLTLRQGSVIMKTLSQQSSLSHWQLQFFAVRKVVYDSKRNKVRFAERRRWTMFQSDTRSVRFSYRCSKGSRGIVADCLLREYHFMGGSLPQRNLCQAVFTSSMLLLNSIANHVKA